MTHAKFKKYQRREKAEISSERIKADFVTLASHQLRTPLSAVKWYLENVINGKRGRITKTQKSYLMDIYRANERAINLVNDLLDVSRIQEGLIHLELHNLKVEKVIQEVLNELEVFIKNKKVNINFEVLKSPLPDVETDYDKLKRVLLNLITNAIKYTPIGGSVEIVAEKVTKGINISVSDTGVGIPKAEQKKVFRKFFRADTAIKLAPDGTGLGLFIAKSLVEVMGGRLGFRSTEGKGSTFYFNLPLKSKS